MRPTGTLSISAYDLREFGRNLDLADDGGAEGIEIFCRNPVFSVRKPAGFTNFVHCEEVRPNPKTRDVRGTARRHVPVTGDLARVFLGQHRIENRLLWQTGRESAHPGLLDEI